VLEGGTQSAELRARREFNSVDMSQKGMADVSKIGIRIVPRTVSEEKSSRVASVSVAFHSFEMHLPAQETSHWLG
jgi:hypothetical protein